MTALAEALNYTQEREIETNEAALAACYPPPSNKLTEAEQASLKAFVNYCQVQRVRIVGAKPTTIAAYLQYQAELGLTADKILEQAKAIESLHDALGLPNPVATLVVRSVLEAALKTEPPRGWRSDEKFFFQQLPPEIRAVIARRENDRDRELRRLQNQTAQLRNSKPKEEIKTNDKEVPNPGTGPQL